MIICAYCCDEAEKISVKGWTEINEFLREYHICHSCCIEHQKKSGKELKDVEFRKNFDEKIKQIFKKNL